jgi:hypothetical protein
VAQGANMKTNDDLESYLIELDIPYEPIGEGLWLCHVGAADIVISHTPPVVVFRVKMFDLPPGNREPLYRKLLELNAQEMVHGAYGIEEESVVLVDALEAENLDANEFRASVDSLALAVHNHHDLLMKLVHPEAASR